VLLALPAIAQSGVVDTARDVYGSIGPAFYGLRTTIVALVFLALLRIKHPEAHKEHALPDPGRLLGLDRCADHGGTGQAAAARAVENREIERIGGAWAIRVDGRTFPIRVLDGQ